MDHAHESLDPEELLAHAGWVRALAVALVGESRADDLAQATMLRAIERPPRHHSNIRGWLGTIARNFAISWSRKENRQRELLGKRVYEDRRDRDTGSDASVLPETPDQLLGKSEAASQVMQALKDLPDPGRHLLMLRYVEGLTPAEIAERHGMKAVTVRVQLSRALEELRRLMRRRFGGDGMAPCRALLAPLPVPWVVPPPAASPTWGPVLAAGGIVTATAVGVYLWDASEDPPADPLTGIVAEQVRPDESERDSASAELASVDGTSDASRAPVESAAAFALRVVDEDGFPVEGARLRQHRAGQSLGSGATDVDGLVERDEALGEGVLQLSLIDHTPELREGPWAEGAHEWVVPERELLAGRVQGRALESHPGLFLALEGDEPLYREGSDEFALLGELDPRYHSLQRFLVSIRDEGEFRFAGLPAGWSGVLYSQDPRFRIDDAGLDDREDGRLRVTAGMDQLRVRLRPNPRLHGSLAVQGADLPASEWQGGVMVFGMPEGLVRLPLAAGGQFELLRDPRELESLTVWVHVPGIGELERRFASVPANGDLGELTLAPLPVHRVRIVNEDGAPIEGADVVAGAPTWLGDELPGGAARTDADGLAAVTLPGDNRTVLVRAAGYAPQSTAVGDTSSPGSAHEITLVRSNLLDLRIEGPDGPLPASVARTLELQFRDADGLASGDPRLDRSFTPRAGSLVASMVTARGLIAADLRPNREGRVALEGLRAGVALALEVRSSTGVRLLAEVLEPLRGDEQRQVVLRLPRAPRSYEGTVTGPDGRAVAEAVVAVRAPRADQDETGWITVRTDLQGRFRLPGLWRDDVTLRISAPGFATRYLPDHRLPAPGVPEAWTLDAGRRLQVEVFGADGLRRAPRHVTARDGEGRFVRSASLDEAGRVALDGLGAADVQLEVFVDGWALACRCRAQDGKRRRAASRRRRRTWCCAAPVSRGHSSSC
jgi:RNA polymerase sigma factor (sigma-70 family)